jgi:hypothetical protein
VARTNPHLATVTEVPPPQPFRLQGFSPSWRLAPPTASPVCFTRQALMGLQPSRAFSSRAARVAFRRLLPSWCCAHVRDGPLTFKALLHARARCPRAVFPQQLRSPMLSWAFSPPGLPVLAAAPPRVPPLFRPRPPKRSDRARRPVRPKPLDRRTGLRGAAFAPAEASALAPTATRQSLSEREGGSFSLEMDRPSWGFRPPSSLPEGSLNRLGQGQSH